MSTVPSNTVDTRELERLQRNLRMYFQVRQKKTEDEILNQKGNDLRIQLFRGFWARRWKGKKVASRLLKSLTKAGKGIRVRLKSLREPWASRVPQKDKNGKPLSLWQKLVAQEMLRRQSGVGILGVSFLRKRWRYKKEGRYLTVNTTKGFGKAVTFEKRDGEFIITGFTPGLATVAEKYALIGGAIRKVSEDIEKYLSGKLGPDFVAALHAS